MLSGETRGQGGSALARHLLSSKDGQTVRQFAARHLAASDLGAQLRELVAGAANGRTDRPVWHVHADPPLGWDRPEVIRSFLHNLETEFGLADQPRLGVLHSGKDGSTRLHAHIVYSLVRQNGRVINLRNSYRRREKCSVITACELGLPPPPVPRPRAILKALLADGRETEARWMVEHYPILGRTARVSDLSPGRRHIAERTGVDPADIRCVLRAAWPPQSAREFQRRLASAGLALARGDKVVVLVDSAGAAHPLSRELRAACRADGREPPRAAQVRQALDGLHLPALDTLKRIKDMATTAEAEQKSKFKERLAAGIIGAEIVDDFRDQVKSAWPAQEGKSSRIYMADGGWIRVDKSAHRVVVTGPTGQADVLASRLAEMEDYEVERSGGRRRRRLRPLFSVGPGDERKVTSLQPVDRFEYWAGKGHTPHRLADGSIAVEIAGTRLVDLGDRVEVHDEPPSDAAIAALVAIAADRWNSGLELYGPWTDEARARTWLECQRAGVVLSSYVPSPELVARWEAEQSSGAGTATGLRPGDGRISTAAPMPATGMSAASPDPDEPELEALLEDPRQEQLAEIERQIANINKRWTTDLRTRDDWVDDARRQLEELERRKQELLGKSRHTDPGEEHEAGYRGPR
jgi:Large polyvalent protein-associated domain 7